jgi:tetratricopeptide (TPR) repeat protein
VRASPNRRHHKLTRSIVHVRRDAARLAAWLTPDDPEARLVVGIERLERHRARSALAPLRLAAQLPQGRVDAWCTLALAQARMFREDEFEAARLKAMDGLGRLSDGFLLDLAAACRRLSAAYRVLARRVRDLSAPGQRWSGVAMRMFDLVWVLSGRRPARVLGTMLDLPATREQRDEMRQRLDTLAHHARAEAARIRDYPKRREAARAKAASGTDTRAELAAAHEDAKAAGWFWEAGHLAELLAKVSLAQHDPQEALRWYGQALEIFGAHHPGEIGRRGLQAARASALLVAGQRSDALAAATQAVRIDPMSSYERDRLADCHFELGDWDQARQAWQAALRFAPDRPPTHHNIALCWFNEALAAGDRQARRTALEQAAAAFERAQSLRAPDDPALADAQFLLAEIRALLGQVSASLALWQTLENRGHLAIAVALRLADLMLREVWADAAERRFELLVTQLRSIAADTPQRMAQPVPMPAGRPDTETHQEALVWALLGQAAAIGQRGLGLTAADALLHAAREACGALPDTGPRRQWLAACDRIDGGVAMQRGDTAAARPLLERALAVSSHAEGYRRLAECLLADLDPALDDPAARALAARVKRLLDHADAVDLDDQHREPLAALRARLAQVAAARWV